MPSSQQEISPTQEELLERFLALRGKAREAEFPSVADVAEMTGCNRNTVLKWINEGKVKAVKVSGRFRVWQPALNRHLCKAA